MDTIKILMMATFFHFLAAEDNFTREFSTSKNGLDIFFTGNWELEQWSLSVLLRIFHEWRFFKFKAEGTTTRSHINLKTSKFDGATGEQENKLHFLPMVLELVSPTLQVFFTDRNDFLARTIFLAICQKKISGNTD